jgi:hypothetical protein
VSSSKGNRRTIEGFWVNPNLQFRFGAIVAATALLVSGMYGAIMFSFLRENYQLLVEMSPMAEEVKSQLQLELRLLWIYLGLATALFPLLCFGWGVYHSHRIAGPIYRIRFVISEILEGNKSRRISLRPNDEFQDLAQDINKLLDQIE